MKKVSLGLTLAAALAAYSAPVLASPYPNIDVAIQALRNAERHLQKAPPRFGGHKAQAGQLIHQAIEQLRQAIQFANQHRREWKGGNRANANIQGGPNGARVNVNVQGQIP
jgi:hypothetical protein